MQQPSHPDHALYSSARDAVATLERGLGRDYDDNSEKLAQASTVLARQSGMERVDHVVLSIHNPHVQAGENLIVVSGQLDDPAHIRAAVKTREALARSEEDNEQLLTQARAQAVAAPQRTIDAPTRTPETPAPTRTLGG